MRGTAVRLSCPSYFRTQTHTAVEICVALKEAKEACLLVDEYTNERDAVRELNYGMKCTIRRLNRGAALLHDSVRAKELEIWERDKIIAAILEADGIQVKARLAPLIEESELIHLELNLANELNDDLSEVLEDRDGELFRLTKKVGSMQTELNLAVELVEIRKLQVEEQEQEITRLQSLVKG
jgi:hypothetical protein